MEKEQVEATLNQETRASWTTHTARGSSVSSLTTPIPTPLKISIPTPLVIPTTPTPMPTPPSNLQFQGGSTHLHHSNVRAEPGPKKRYSAEWICPGCQGLNFSKRVDCFKCHAAKPETGDSTQNFVPKLVSSRNFKWHFEYEFWSRNSPSINGLFTFLYYEK